MEKYINIESVTFVLWHIWQPSVNKIPSSISSAPFTKIKNPLKLNIQLKYPIKYPKGHRRFKASNQYDTSLLGIKKSTGKLDFPPTNMADGFTHRAPRFTFRFSSRSVSTKVEARIVHTKKYNDTNLNDCGYS